MIRPAREADREFVAAFVPSLLEFGSPAWEDPGVLGPGFRKVLADAVADQDAGAAVLIAEREDGGRVGFISLKLREDLTGVARAHVADLAVAEGSRREGVGRELMRAAEAWARERGLTMLSLDVWSTNERALAFYRTLGYRPESLCLIKAVES